jgi:hypothetical protein
MRSLLAVLLLLAALGAVGCSWRSYQLPAGATYEPCSLGCGAGAGHPAPAGCRAACRSDNHLRKCGPFWCEDFGGRCAISPGWCCKASGDAPERCAAATGDDSNQVR